MKKYLLAFLAFAPHFAFASFEGVWVGSGGLLTNSRGWQSPCESARLDVVGEIGTYKVTFEASCGGIHYKERFNDVRADGASEMYLKDQWGYLLVTKSQGKLHVTGDWHDITWPKTAGTVDAHLEIDLQK